MEIGFYPESNGEPLRDLSKGVKLSKTIRVIWRVDWMGMRQARNDANLM